MKKFKEWTTWILQMISMMGGIAVVIKELIPKHSGNKSLFSQDIVQPNVQLLVLTGLLILIFWGILKWWRDK